MVQQTQVLKQINGVILRSNRVKSCTAGKKQSNIDFFIAFGGTDALVESVEARLGTTVKTHRPVRVVLFSNPRQLRMRTMKIPPPMGKAPVIGPKASRSFDKIRQTVRTALQMAMEGDRFTSSKALSAMYGAWCDEAELEVEANTGEQMAVHGIRGKKPVYKWAPLLDGNKKGPIKTDAVLKQQLESIAMIKDQMLNLSATVVNSLADSVMDEKVLVGFRSAKSAVIACLLQPNQTQSVQGMTKGQLQMLRGRRLLTGTSQQLWKRHAAL